MSTAIKLGDLYDQGYICTSIRKEFKGVPHSHSEDKMQITDVLTFASDEATPDAEAIRKFIMKRFEELGYSIQDISANRARRFEARILPRSEKGIQVYVTVTTRLPLRGLHNSLRVTTMKTP